MPHQAGELETRGGDRGQGERALDTRTPQCSIDIHNSLEKALSKNDANYKAVFRKAKALGELGFFERAEPLLEDLIKKSPSGACFHRFHSCASLDPLLAAGQMLLPRLPNSRASGRWTRNATARTSRS